MGKHIVTVYPWEFDVIKDWDVNELRNRIWAFTQCNQSIPGCVSVEALRIELVRRGETPNGYHEDAKDVDISNIVIAKNTQVKKRSR